MMGEERTQTLRVEDIASAAGFERASAASQRLVEAAHIRIYYQLTRLSVYVGLGLALLIGLSLHGHVPAAGLYGWGAVLLVVALWRHGLAVRFDRVRPADAELPRWGRAAWLGALLQSLVWTALLPLAAYSERPADQFAVFYLMCALGFGAFATLGFFFKAYTAFALPMLVALFLWFLLEVPEVSLWIGLLSILGVVVMGQAGARATRVLRGALLLSAERAEWVRAATAANERMQVTLRAISDGVISTDVDGRVIYANAAAERLTGAGRMNGRLLSEVLRTSDDDPLPDLVARCLAGHEPLRLDGERTLRDGRGQHSQVQISAVPIRDAAVGVVVELRDVTEQSDLVREIRFHAEHDGLTGLPNRKSFEAAMAEAMTYSRHHGTLHAICYLDLDQFKIVNDTCGHSAGDELLKALSVRLRERVREGDVLARLGGDEFGVLLFRCPPAKARQVAEQLVELVRDFRFVWEGKVFNIGVSIGLVPFDASASPTQLLAAADAACFVAKDQGRNRVHLVGPEDGEVASRHDEMRQTTLIQQALDDDLFRLRLQRIESLQDPRAPTKAEFLVSMAGPAGQLVPPAQFLPAAERFNMMPRLDRHVVRLALGYVAGDLPELDGISSFAINLSGQSLADETFLDYVVEQVALSGVDPGRICFEITETAVIASLDRALIFMNRLRAAGCQFALDDFGAGLSSFGYLRRLPVDYIKIDGQFVRNMCDDPINRSIVEAIQGVGHIMQLKTVAESVEDGRTRELLREIGVDYGQGWGIHEPELLARPGAARDLARR